MTTKPKTTGTTVAAKASAPADAMKETKPNWRRPVTESGWPIENRYDRNFSSNDVPKLIARWRFLEADRQYHAAVADHPELARLARGRHQEERSKIGEKLVEMVPDNFEDASALFEFAIEALIPFFGMNAMNAKDLTGMRMLRNVKAGISKAQVKLRVEAAFSRLDAIAEARKEFARIGA